METRFGKVALEPGARMIYETAHYYPPHTAKEYRSLFVILRRVKCIVYADILPVSARTGGRQNHRYTT